MYKSIYSEAETFTDEERSLFVNFLNSLEDYQYNHYGNYDRTILLNSYKALPETIKKKIAHTKKIFIEDVMAFLIELL